MKRVLFLILLGTLVLLSFETADAAAIKDRKKFDTARCMNNVQARNPAISARRASAICQKKATGKM
jgi:hypothetical protein